MPHSLHELISRKAPPSRRSLSGASLLLGACALAGLATPPAAAQKAQGTQAPSKPSQARPVVLALDWVPNTNHTGFYVARHRKFYVDAGVAPQIIQPTQTSTTKLVAAGRAEFGVSFTHDLLQARAQGLPVVSIAAIIQENTSCFAARKNVGLKSMKDFEGKRYGGWGSPEEALKIEFLMKKAGADFKKVKMVTTGISDFLPSTVKNADIMWIYMGWDGIKAKLEGVDVDTLCVRDLEPTFNTHSPLIITSEKVLKEKPELVRAFLAATAKGYEIAIKDPGVAAKELVAEVPEIGIKLADASARYLAPEYAKGATRWGVQDKANLARYIEWTKAQKLITKFDAVDAYFTNDYLPK